MLFLKVFGRFSEKSQLVHIPIIIFPQIGENIKQAHICFNTVD